MNSFSTSFNAFKVLIIRDLQSLKRVFWGKQIDQAIIVFILIIINGYLLPKIGLNKNYGAFFVIGNIVSCSFFEIYSNMFEFSADLISTRNITYDLTLPVRSHFVFIKQALIYTINGICISFFVLPFGVLMLWPNFDLSSISWIKMIAMYISVNLFFGFFTIFIASFVKSFDTFRHLWCRGLFPMWLLGSQAAAWAVMYSLSKELAYLTLLNPMVYAMEGMRAAAFGQEGSLSFWFCLIMLWFFTILVAWIGILQLSRRLDIVR